MAYLNTEQAAYFLGFVRREVDDAGRTVEVADRAKFLDHVTRHRIPTFHRGRAVVVRERDLEASLTPRHPHTA